MGFDLARPGGDESAAVVVESGIVTAIAFGEEAEAWMAAAARSNSPEKP